MSNLPVTPVDEATFDESVSDSLGKVESDDHIWNLVHYLRTLRRGRSEEQEPASE